MLKAEGKKRLEPGSVAGFKLFRERLTIHHSLSTTNHPPPSTKGQVMLEFTFCMIVVLLMIYGAAKVFIWTGKDLAGRRIAHENMLTTPFETAYGDCVLFETPIKEDEEPSICLQYSFIKTSSQRQIDPYFYTPIGMNAIWKGK